MHFTGLRRTKAKTLQQIIRLEKGDRISAADTATVFATLQRDLYNTKLFTAVDLNTTLAGDSIDLEFVLIERWYTYVAPHFDLIDRNFNEWWVIRNRDPERVIVGVDITQKNSTGRNDDISFSVLTGFQQKGEIRYRLPYHFMDGKLGVEAKGLFHRYRSVNFATENDQLQFESFEQPQLNRYEGSISANYFPKYTEKRWLTMGYHSEQIGQDLLLLNPLYLGLSMEELHYGFVKIGFQSDHRDVRGYASKGVLVTAELTSFRFFANSTLNFSELRTRVVMHQPITAQWNIAASVGAKVSPDKTRPYFLNRGLGWDVNRIRNYDYYAVDGSSYLFEKLALRYRAFDRILTTKIPIKQFQKIPLKLVPKVYFDFGYVVDNVWTVSNSFINRPLWSYGVGIDVVLYDDAVWRFELGRNHLGEAAFFLNFTSAIQ